MLRKRFLNLKQNLIYKGISKEDIENFCLYLNQKEGKIIFPERLASKFKISYFKSQEILSFLANKNLTKPFFRLEYEECTSQYLDFDKITDIPSEVELDECFIKEPLNHVQILYKVSMHI